MTGTIKVANDLVCPETDGLIAGADNTIIDLNGHTISCVSPAGFLGSCQGNTFAGGISETDPVFENGVEIINRRNVRVFTSRPGGTLNGFDNGVRIRGSENVKVEFLTITGPQAPRVANTRPASHGVLINGAECGGQIHVGTGQNRGNNISNHNQGIAANGDCVEIVHNRISNINGGNIAARGGLPSVAIPSNGILINQGSRNVVRGNEVELVGDEDETIDAGVRIRREDSDDAEQGGLSTDNLVTNNIVSDNLGDGILITEGATANYIVNNTMMRNGGTLSGTVFFDAAGRGAPGGPPGSQPLNEWNRNNRCLTQNEEVPPGTCGADEGG